MICLQTPNRAANRQIRVANPDHADTMLLFSSPPLHASVLPETVPVIPNWQAVAEMLQKQQTENRVFHKCSGDDPSGSQHRLS